MENKHCKFCGRLVEANSKFCFHCGGNIEDITQTENNSELENNTDIIDKIVFSSPNKSNQISDQIFIIGLISFLIMLFWVLIGRFMPNSFKFENKMFLKPISILTAIAVPLLCAIFTKRQINRIVLAIITGIIFFYYIFIFYFETNNILY